MKLSQFKFTLPDESIAQFPSKHRDESKLLVIHRDSDKIEHIIFKDILDFFDEKVFLDQEPKITTEKKTSLPLSQNEFATNLGKKFTEAGRWLATFVLRYFCYNLGVNF